MSNKTTMPNVGDAMSVGIYRQYILHFYNGILRDAGKLLGDGKGSIQRAGFYSVANALVAAGDFKTGENFRLSQVAVADISGKSTATVRRVLALLEYFGAIEVVDLSRRAGGGKPVKVYRLVYSSHVRKVIKDGDRNRNRDHWKREDRGSNGHCNPIAMAPATPANGSYNPSQCELEPHKRNVEERITNGSDESSPAPVVALTPDGASDGAAESENKKLSMDPAEIDALLGHGSNTAQTAAVAPVAQPAYLDDLDDLKASLDRL